MQYDTTVTISIPDSIRDIANKIGKAFDPDTGGDHTFDADGVDGVITVSFPCVHSFAAVLPSLVDKPEELYAMVLQDYAARWQELTPPTIEEVVKFCKELSLQ